MSAGPLKLPTKSPRKGYRPVVGWGLRGEYNRVSMAEGKMRMGVGVINAATGRRHRVFLEGGYAQGPARYLYRVEFWHEWGRMRSGNPGRLSIRHQTEIAERYRSHHLKFSIWVIWQEMALRSCYTAALGDHGYPKKS